MSFSVSFKPINLDKIVKKLEKIGPAQDKAILQGLAEGVLLVHSTAVKSIQSHQSQGNEYWKHTASKPGFPPNSDTGTLVRSIRWEIDSEKKIGVVGTNLMYGAWLEFGTRFMDPRPWLLPAFTSNLKQIVEGFTKAAKDALK